MLGKLFRLVARKTIFLGSKETPTTAESEVKQEKVKRAFSNCSCDTCSHKPTCPIVSGYGHPYSVRFDPWPVAPNSYDHNPSITGLCHYEPRM